MLTARAQSETVDSHPPDQLIALGGGRGDFFQLLQDGHRQAEVLHCVPAPRVSGHALHAVRSRIPNLSSE